MKFGPTIPVLRIFDDNKAREFYQDFLGFERDWEYRHEADLPTCMGISRGDCVLHLSEHHGDCTPGSSIRIQVDEIDAFHAELVEKKYRHARPGIDDMPWGTREFYVMDPFGNRLNFFCRIQD